MALRKSREGIEPSIEFLTSIMLSLSKVGARSEVGIFVINGPILQICQYKVSRPVFALRCVYVPFNRQALYLAILIV